MDTTEVKKGSSLASFVKYLKEAKAHAKTSTRPIRVALGNTSGDMDSIVGALAMAHYLTLREKCLWIPLVNCNKADLKLKPEIWGHLVDECGLDPEDFVFFDELLSFKREYGEFALIDHNKIDSVQAMKFGGDAHKKVTHVYDHHVDQKAYDFSQLVDYQTRFIGSACSILVIKMRLFFDLYDPELFNKKDPRNFAYFVAAAVVLDTNDFLPEYRNKKWSQEDEESGQWLAKYAEIGKEYFDKMQNNKFSKEVSLKFDLMGNIRRDYKQYELAKGSVQGRLGCAVMVFSPDQMFERYGEAETLACFDQYMIDHDLQMFAIMCNIMHMETGEMERRIFVYTKRDSDFANTFDGLVLATRESTMLKCKDEVRKQHNHGAYAHWNLENTGVSRKKYEIVFRAFYQ